MIYYEMDGSRQQMTSSELAGFATGLRHAFVRRNPYGAAARASNYRAVRRKFDRRLIAMLSLVAKIYSIPGFLVRVARKPAQIFNREHAR